MIMERRKEMVKKDEEDILDQLSKDMDSQKFLSENFVLHFVYVTLFASTDTILAVVPLLLKFLEENPLALQELKVK